MRERDIERHLVKRVNELGGEVRKAKWIGRRGAPDRLLMLPMRVVPVFSGGVLRTHGVANAATIWVELKAPGKNPTAAQLREHERMRRMGQRVEVIDSIEAVEALLS